MIDRAAAADYEALVLTVDTAVFGRRERDVRRGFSLPPTIGPGTIVDGALHPGWTWAFVRSEPIRFANVVGRDVGDGASPVTLSDYINTQFDPSLSWDDVDWLRSVWDGPIVLKGIQTVDDAVLAADAGVDAIALSNHGGRQLDGAPAAFDLVAPVADAVGGRIEIICDGGVRRGSDIVKAVAAGATAAMAGRAYLYGLGAGGRTRRRPRARLVPRRPHPHHEPPRRRHGRRPRPLAARDRTVPDVNALFPPIPAPTALGRARHVRGRGARRLDDDARDRAAATTACGIDRLVVSDHVVFGEHLDAYGRPELGGTARRAPADRARRALARAAHHVERDRGRDRTRAARRPASCSPRCDDRSCSRRRRRRSTCSRADGSTSASASAGNARSTRPPGSTSTRARPPARPHARGVHRAVDRAGRAATSRPSSTFDRIHMMPKPLQPGGVPIWVSGRINARVVDRLVPLRAAVDPVGRRRGRPRTLDPRRCATGSRPPGTAPDGLQVVANLRVVQDRRRRPSTSTARWSRCRGVGPGTDFLPAIGPWPDPSFEAELTELVAAFRPPPAGPRA